MGLFDDIGRTVSNAVGTVLHTEVDLVNAVVGAVVGVIKTAVGDLEGAVKIAENVFSGYIQGVGRMLLSEGMLIYDAITYPEHLYADLISGALGVRPLRPHEKAVAQEVFQGTVPLDRVVLSSLSGPSDRPFTVPVSLMGSLPLALALPGYGALLAIANISGNLVDKYVIFIGPAGYRDPFNYPGKFGVVAGCGATLIHELTHVWQGHNNAFAWGYVADSLAMQCMLGGGAYSYVPGDQWSSYHAEPQAQIVEDWYNAHVNGRMLPPNGVVPRQFAATAGSLKPTIAEAYYAYIHCNVQRGQPHAPTVFPVISSSALAKSAAMDLMIKEGVPTIHTSLVTANRRLMQSPLTIHAALMIANRDALKKAPLRAVRRLGHLRHRP